MTSSPSVLLAIGFGVLTALTPCVFPMIPITLAICGAKGASRARAAALAACYTAGISVLFGVLGTIVVKLGITFGTHLGSPFFVIPLVLFFVAMSLSMFGAFEVALPQGLQERLSRVGGRGFVGSFLMGMAGGLIAAPCTGPPLAGILGYISTTHDTTYGFLLCSAYGLGIGLPFFLVAAFSMTLPKSGSWMDYVKGFFGISLLTGALYYLKNIVPALERFTSPAGTFALGMAILIFVGLAVGALHLSFHGGLRERLRKGAGVALVTTGLLGIVNYWFTPKGPIELRWLADEPAAVAEARAANRPLLVDFRANWCLPCKEFEAKVFSKPEVSKVLEGYTLLRVDLTHEDDAPALGAVKKKYGADTLPAIRLVAPDGALLAKTDEFMEADAFLKLLNTRGGT
jgi:thiol:disulfide interchange protein DsbD